jgi:hypothetical protein
MPTAEDELARRDPQLLRRLEDSDSGPRVQDELRARFEQASLVTASKRVARGG